MALNDYDRLEAVKGLVEDAFNNYPRWIWSNKGELRYTVAMLVQAYMGFGSEAFRQRAWAEIATHGRLSVDFLKALGVWKGF